MPYVLPDRKDPRLRLAVVVITLQVLGQTMLRFRVSIAQILVSILVCALVEVAVTYRRQRVLAWPSSAILTGNSVAFILRANGTLPGDWWSLNGVQYFVLAALISILSKYLIRPGGRHIYNPSNLGLVVTFLLVGPTAVFPQYLWWGPLDFWVFTAWVVIVVGGVWVLWGLRMAPMVIAFAAVFAVLVAVNASAGVCFAAVWRLDPVCGPNYWLAIAASPEVAIFVLLMMSDPRTAPGGRWARAGYGAATAAVAVGLVILQPSEFGIKVALLAALTVVCAAVPLLDAAWWRQHLDRQALRAERPGAHPAFGRAALSWLAVITITVTVLVGTLAVAFDPLATEIETGGRVAGASVQ